MTLEELNERWKRKTMGKASKWASAVSGSTDRYVEGLAVKTGIPSSTIASGPMGSGFREFAAHASEYADDFAKGVEAAAAANKWLKGFRRALTGSE